MPNNNHYNWTLNPPPPSLQPSGVTNVHVSTHLQELMKGYLNSVSSPEGTSFDGIASSAALQANEMTFSSASLMEPDSWPDDDGDGPYPGEEFPAPPDSLDKEQVDDNEEMNIHTTKLSKVFKYDPVAPAPVEETMKELEEICKKEKVPISSVSKKVELGPRETAAGTLVGIEIELESGLDGFSKTANENRDFALGIREVAGEVWRRVADGSLRNHGVEWVSKQPFKAEDVPDALRILEVTQYHLNKKAQLNFRCGTHVHLDVREFTVAQLINFCILYILFEETLYAMSGKRWKNTFCVPIRASMSEMEGMFRLLHIEKPTYAQLRAVFKKFKKYMAFNLCPVGYYIKQDGPHDGQNKPLGSVEFRHHEGCADPVRLSYWIRTLLCLHTAAKTLPYEEIRELIFGLNTRSNYMEFANKVFGQIPQIEGFTTRDIITDMYRGSLFVKELYLSSKGEE